MTTFLAVWGALLSSIMAGFEAFKFLHRARLRVTVGDGYLIIAPGHQNDGVHHLSFVVKNVGSQATTLENVGVYGYNRSKWNWRKPLRKFERDKAAVITAVPLPFVLQPGHKWGSQMPQGEVQRAFGDYDRVVFFISHSMASKEVQIVHQFTAQPKGG